MMTKLHTVDVVVLKALAKPPINNESALKIEAASSSTLHSSFVWMKALCTVIAATSPSLSPVARRPSLQLAWYLRYLPLSAFITTFFSIMHCNFHYNDMTHDS
jgi:hypothetical protein